MNYLAIDDICLYILRTWREEADAGALLYQQCLFPVQLTSLHQKHSVPLYQKWHVANSPGHARRHNPTNVNVTGGQTYT